MGSNILLILAAGSSSRLGQPKQLIPFKGVSLLRHIVQLGLRSNFSRVGVVLGFEYELMASEIMQYEVDMINNPQWQEGLASSVKSGIEHASAFPDVEAAGICLVDQPFVSVDLLNSLLTSAPSTSVYPDGKTGVPAVFVRSQFPKLAALTGDSGARDMIRNSRDFTRIEFKKGHLDIDTPDDLSKLNNLGL